MKIVRTLAAVSLLAAACGSPSAPEGEDYPWEHYEWHSCREYMPFGLCSVSWAVRRDSLYVRAVQSADSSSWQGCHMPYLLSFEILADGEYPGSYHRDGNRACIVSMYCETADWYEYHNPYGDKGGAGALEGFQPDSHWEGMNDVELVFIGEVRGDATLVFRKACSTGDYPDVALLPDSAYQARVWLEWREPHQFVEESDVFPLEYP